MSGLHGRQRGVPPELRPYVAAALRAGWSVRPTRRGHVSFYRPDGAWAATYSATSGDWRAIRNCRSKLRRAGLRL